MSSMNYSVNKSSRWRQRPSCCFCLKKKYPGGIVLWQTSFKIQLKPVISRFGPKDPEGEADFVDWHINVWNCIHPIKLYFIAESENVLLSPENPHGCSLTFTIFHNSHSQFLVRWLLTLEVFMFRNIDKIAPRYRNSIYDLWKSGIPVCNVAVFKVFTLINHELRKSSKYCQNIL